MADLLLHLRGMADIVIVDTPPLLAVTDGVVVAVQTDGALLVSRYGKTSQARTTAAAQALQAVDARLLGCVLNMVKINKSDARQYLAYQVEMPGAGAAEEAAGRDSASRDEAPDATASAAEELTRAPR